MPTFKADELVALGVRILVAAGVRESTATEVIQSLVLANLTGMDSHGMMRIGQYMNALKTGAIVADAEAKVVRENEVIVILDGCKAFGQVVAKQAMRMAIDKARRHGIGAASYTNVHHIGCASEYVSLAAKEGMIGVMFVNGTRPGGMVAPYGARERMLGTNPIAFAVPAGSCPALIADFATSAVSEGKVRIHHRKGEKIPTGWVLDKEGRPTNNPADLYNGGALLTFGGYKGSALSLLVEVLGGILSGLDTPIFPSYKVMYNGVFALVIQPSFFRPLADYTASVDYLFQRVKDALPAQGMQGALIPGEPEAVCKATRERTGILIDETTLSELREIATSLGVVI